MGVEDRNRSGSSPSHTLENSSNVKHTLQYYRAESIRLLKQVKIALLYIIILITFFKLPPSPSANQCAYKKAYGVL